MQNKVPVQSGGLAQQGVPDFCGKHRAAICGAHLLQSPGEASIMNISLF